MFNDTEIAKIATAIREKLQVSRFTFESIKVKYQRGGSGLQFTFVGCAHPLYKNVRLIAYDAWVKDTTLVTVVHMRLGFLQGAYTSPIIGNRITSLKIVLS